jgi:hypothetical protein
MFTITILHINSRSPCVRDGARVCKSGRPGPARHTRPCTRGCGLRIEVRGDDDADPLEFRERDVRDK